MILNAERKQFIDSHGVTKEGQKVLAWNIATVVFWLCRSGGRFCRNCDCQETITKAWWNTVEQEYTPVANLAAVREKLQTM